MDKVTEEVLTSLIKRVEALEEVVPKTKPNIGTKYPEKKGMVTPGQLNFIKGLGGVPDPNLTSYEASKYIDRLKEEKRKASNNSVPEKSVQNNNSEPERRLTQEEIDDLPEEAFL